MIHKGFLLGGTTLGSLVLGITGGFISPGNTINATNLKEVLFTRYKKIGKELAKATNETVGNPGKQIKNEVHSELQKSYFGDGRYLSEGGMSEIHLVNNEGKYIKINAEKHSRRKRDMGGGKDIEVNQGWYGPRSFPFNAIQEEIKKGDLNNSGLAYLKILKQISREELRELSNHLNDYSNEQWCEIIDTIGSCQEFKNQLMSDSNKDIKNEFKLQLEHLSDLTGMNINKPDGRKISEVIDKVIEIKKFENIKKHISQYGVNGMKEYYEGKNNQGINPFSLLMDLLHNQEIGFKCNESVKGEESTTEGDKYFKECGQKISGTDVKVINVLKGVQGKGNELVVAKNNGKKEKNLSEIGQEKIREVNNGLKSKGIHNGFVSEDCDHLMWGGFFPSIEQKFCAEMMKQILGRDNRYCLYQIPSGKGYLRAYKYKIFHFVYGIKGDKFGAKCETSQH